MRKETVRYTSYFDEAVTGLEVGSPISFRGVTIGNVAEIGIAPDRRHVEIIYGPDGGDIEATRAGAPRRARLHHLGAKGHTRADRIDRCNRGQVREARLLENAPGAAGPPFDVPENNIPAIPSTLKNIEQAVSRSLDRVPEILDQISSLVQRADTFMATLDNRGLADKASGVMLRADRAFDTLDKKLAGLDTQGISADARHALAGMEDTMGDARRLMSKLDSESGLFDSVQRATDAVGDVAVGARGTAKSSTARSTRSRRWPPPCSVWSTPSNRTSDMLLKGRARSAP